MSTTPDLSSVAWVKSSYSNGDGGDCVEWSPTIATTSGLVPVRDSKDPTGPALLFRPEAWTAFITAVAEGKLRP
ncbi:hypothetical protein GCM10027168_36010 [Streptomyces capparidis]